MAASTSSLSGMSLYVDPDSSAARAYQQAKASGSSNTYQLSKIGTWPIATWFGNWNSNVQADANYLVTAAKAKNQTPVVVIYNIPQRDCGQYSAGGANSPTAYNQWIDAMANGINGRQTIVILEPDALGLMNCLSAADKQVRYDLLKRATQVLTQKGALVYIEASTWVAPADMAVQLQNAGIAGAAGFAINTSGFNWTADMTRYGTDVSNRIGGKHFVIDTSRNGNGPWNSTEPETWCNPPDRALGVAPNVNPGVALVDAYLWIKTPGESDGTCRGGPSAGTWWPDYALGLAQRSTTLPNTGSPTPTPPPPAPSPTPATPVGVGTYNDTVFTYNGTWQVGDNAVAGFNKYMGDDHYSSTTGSTYSLTYSGTQAKVYAAKAPQHGIAAISIDNGTETMVDLYAATRADQQLVYTSPVATSGTHTVRVRVTGNKNASSTGVSVNADKIDISNTTAPTPPPPAPSPTPTPSPVAPGTYNDTQFAYTGTWQMGDNSVAGFNKYQADDHYTQEVNATYSLTYTGTQVKVYASKAPQHGIAAVRIDSGAEIMVDLYAATRADQQLIYTSPLAANGTHTVRVRVTGNKNTSSTGTAINADKIEVGSATSTPTPPPPAPTPPATSVPGDANGDGRVNGLDYSVLASHDGQNYVPADFNKDGVVGAADLAILLAKWTW